MMQTAGFAGALQAARVNVQRGEAMSAIGSRLIHGAALQPAAGSVNACQLFNLAGVDLVSIRLVVLCAELGSLHAAAKQGNLSLSSASHRLTNLEALLRTRLFQRDHRGLQLTESGAVFVVHARTVLQALHRLGSELASMTVD